MLSAFYVFPQIWVVISLKSEFSQNSYPQLYIVPKERQVEVIDVALDRNKEYTSSGYKLKSPWIDQVGQENKQDSEIILFKNQKAMFFFKLRNTFNLKASTFTNNPVDSQKLREFLGVDTFGSNYKFNKSVLATSPGSLSIFESKKEVLADSVLLSLKLVTLLPFKGGVYSFQTPSLRGFQYGDPAVSDGIILQIFDNKDQEFKIGLRGATQKDIDFILSSMKFAD